MFPITMGWGGLCVRTSVGDETYGKRLFDIYINRGQRTNIPRMVRAEKFVRVSEMMRSLLERFSKDYWTTGGGEKNPKQKSHDIERSHRNTRESDCARHGEVRDSWRRKRKAGLRRAKRSRETRIGADQLLASFYNVRAREQTGSTITPHYPRTATGVSRSVLNSQRPTAR